MSFIMVFASKTDAQVSAYSFAQSAGAYTPIIAGTVLGVATNDDTSFPNLPIGFTFNYNGVNYTNFSVNSNGFISMGATIASSYTAISTGATNNTIAALNGDLQGNTTTGELRYETTGLTPNSVLVIQWKSYRHFGATGDDNSFQIRLSETSNQIQVVYGAFTQNATTRTRQIGLRGATNADFNNRTTTTNWSATTAGGTNAATCTLTTAIKPASGQTYTWTPPTPCTGTPTAGTTAGPAGACSAVNFTLSLSGATTGVTGLTYQWQTSPDNITYTNIAATSSTASVNQIAATYYQCIVTCTPSGMSSTSTPLFVPMNSFINCYCTSNATSIADEDIFNVSLGTLNNTSTCATTGGAGSILNEYSNYTAVAAPNLAQTASYPLSVQIGTCGGSFTNSTRVFIDYNQNGLFTDAGETVYTSAAGTAGPHTEISSIIIPAGATLGNTRMRVVTVETGTPTSITPCGTYTWGETEDYFVNIIALPPTPPTPTQSAAIPTCAGGTDLSVAGSPAPGDAWYWQTFALGTSTTTPVSGPYTVFLNGTYYVRTYNAVNGVWSAASSSVTVSNIPVAPLPPSPTAISPSCLNTSITVTPATGTTTYYWQGTNATGTSTALDAASPYTASSSGTYYVAAFDASTSCWSNTSGVAVVIDAYVPPTPTSTSNPLNICLNSVSGMINATSPSSGTLTASFGTSLSSPGTPVTFNITVPALPAGATITGTQLQVMGATALGASYRSEIRVALSGSTTLAATQISLLTSAGLITPDPSITVPNLPVGGGPVTLTLSETFDDAGTDATFTEIKLVISYTLPASTITWWDASTAGTQIGSGSPFESVGTIVLPNTGTLGAYSFYAMATSGSCSSTRLTVDVNVNALPVVTASSTASAVCFGSMVTLNGGGATTYSWDNGVTNNVAFSASTTTTYNVIGTDVNGCADTTSILLTVNPLPVVSASSTPIACSGGTSTVTISATSGMPAYVGTGTYTQAAGTVVYVVTDANSCSGNTSVTLTEPTVVVASSSAASIMCNGGTAMVTISATGGTGALSGTGTFPQSAGTVVYTVTDANGCTGTVSQTLTEPTAVMVMSSFTPIACNGGTSTVTISGMDGTPGYTGTGTFTQSAGTTSYTITDANGCPASANVTITQPTVLAATSSGTSIPCFGGSSTVTVSPTGGTSPYTISGSPFTVPAGSYTFNITDANGCATSTSITITEPSELFIGSGATTIMCNGGSSTVTISAIGGTLAYTGTGTFSQTAGTVNYVVTDANGCSVNTNVTITEPSAIVPALSSTAILCNGGAATVTISATGGTGAYTGTGTFSQSVGTTVYTVTDFNGCTATVSQTLTEPTAVMVMYSSTSILCNGDSSAVTISGMDGTPGYTGTGTFNQAAGTVTYTITDANGCVGAANVSITQPAAIGLTQTINLCPGGSVTVGTSTYNTNGTFTDILTAANTCDSTVTTTVIVNGLPVVTASADNDTICSGGTVMFTGGGALTYVWDNSVTDGIAFTPLTSGTTIYNVTGTDVNGCVNTASTAVTVNTLPFVTASADKDTVCAGTTITLTSGGATSYAWDNAVIDGVAFAAADTTYIVTGTDANGCMNTASVMIVVNSLPTVTLTSFTAPVCLQASAMILTGGSPTGGIYSGTGVAAGSFDPSVAGVGSFPITYTLTDTNSCTNSASSSISVQDCTGIEENLSSSEVSVYPNPTLGSFNIFIDNVNFDELYISIFDIQGKEVFTSEDKNVSGAYNKQINLEDISKGVYYIKLSTGSEVKVQKLIIQ